MNRIEIIYFDEWLQRWKVKRIFNEKQYPIEIFPSYQLAILQYPDAYLDTTDKTLDQLFLERKRM